MNFTSWTTGSKSILPGCGTPKELDALLTCLKLRVPEALFRPYSEFSKYCTKSEEEWQELELNYQHRVSQRELDLDRKDYAAAQSNPHFVFSDLQGQHTSRFNQETVKEQLSGLKEGCCPVGLEVLDPIPVPGMNGMRLSGLCASAANEKLLLITKMQVAGGSTQFFAKAADRWEIQRAFTDLLENHQVPDFSNLSLWQPLQMAGQSWQAQRKLIYSDNRGSTREFSSFSRRDVELARENLASGKYTVVALYVGAEYLYLQTGSTADRRVTVNADRPGPDELRVFEIKCTDRQAIDWLLAMNDGIFAPNFSQWKDITKQLQKQASKK